MTTLTDSNIGEFIRMYFETPEDLSKDLQNITKWDTSRVRVMISLFKNRSMFNEPLDWNVSNVSMMSNMFEGCVHFNQPLNHWNVGKVKYMNNMFQGCIAFNQSLEDWDVDRVEFMSKMFQGCITFNQPLEGWDVSSVKDMSYMFQRCRRFNQPLEGWDIDNVTNMAFMFEGCEWFNQPLNEWRISNKVLVMDYMFQGCIRFNQPLTEWTTNGGISVAHMFENCLIDRENVPPLIRPRLPPVDLRQINQERMEETMEVHTMARNIKYDNLLHFFIQWEQDNGLSSPVRLTHDSMIHHIRETLTYLIEGVPDLTVDPAIVNLDQLNVLMEKLETMTDICEIGPTTIKVCYFMLLYITDQPPAFISQYLNDLFFDTLYAHVDRMSCVGGILERMLLTFGSASLTTDPENPEYKKINSMLIRDILEEILEWYKTYSIPKEGHPERPWRDEFMRKTPDQRKEMLRAYLLELYPNPREVSFVNEKINEYEQAIGFEDDAFMEARGKRRVYRKTKKNGTKRTKKSRKLLKKGKGGPKKRYYK
jgi:surface protein